MVALLATTITWTSSGDGSFDNNTSLTPIYTPGASDISSGSVTITATTDDPDGAGSCLAATASLVLTIDPAPIVDAGADQSICTGDPVSLTGVLGGSAISATWTTNGDGSFDNATNLNATYTPGTTDIANGTVSLSLASDPTTTCLIITDVLTITINQPIIVIDQTASQNAGVTTVIDVTNGSTINTGDVLTTTIVTSPLKGTAVVNANGSISYTSNQGNVGSDSFDFQVCNQCGLCDQATATITINNEPPVSNIPPAAGQTGGILTINVLDGITDVNGNIDLSSFKVIIQPTSGASASFDQDGNLIVDYTGINFVGTDELTIEVFVYLRWLQ